MIAANVVVISLDLLVRPIREEIDEHLPPDVETTTHFGSRSRMAAGMAPVAWEPRGDHEPKGKAAPAALHALSS